VRRTLWCSKDVNSNYGSYRISLSKWGNKEKTDGI
jgi:hypothetical protein